jgi:outer membrane lipoprotein-sorting protein
MNRLLLIAILTCWAAPSAADTASADAILKVLDSRVSDTDVRMLNEVARIESGKPVSIRRYRLNVNGDGRVLLESLDPGERGQKILSTPDAVWFYAPRSRRAIRVPASQRLFGEASIGDIANVRWGRDYRADGPPVLESPNLLRLALNASSEAATYQRVNVWVRKDDFVPVRASFALASGKVHKIASYDDARLVNGLLQINSWSLSEPNRTNVKTQIRTSDFKVTPLPDAWFTRAFLETGL